MSSSQHQQPLANRHEQAATGSAPNSNFTVQSNPHNQGAHRPQNHPTPSPSAERAFDLPRPNIISRGDQELKDVLTNILGETSEAYYRQVYYNRVVEEVRKTRELNQKLLSDNMLMARQMQEFELRCKRDSERDAHIIQTLRDRISLLELAKAPLEREIKVLRQQLTQSQDQNYAILEQKYLYCIGMLSRHHIPIVSQMKDGQRTVRIAEEQIAMDFRTSAVPSQTIDLTTSSPTTGESQLVPSLNQSQRPRGRPHLNPNAAVDSRIAGHYHDIPTRAESQSTVRGFNPPPMSSIPQPQIQGQIRGHDDLPIKHKPTPNPPQIQHQQRDNQVNDILRTSSSSNEPSSSSQLPVHSHPTSWHSTAPLPSAPGQSHIPAVSTGKTRLIQPYPAVQTQIRPTPYQAPLHTQNQQPEPRLVPAVFNSPSIRNTSPPLSDESRPQSSLSVSSPPSLPDPLQNTHERRLQPSQSPNLNVELVGGDSTSMRSGSARLSQPSNKGGSQDTITQQSGGAAKNDKRDRDTNPTSGFIVSPNPHVGSPGTEDIVQYIPQAKELLRETSQSAVRAAKRQKLSIDIHPTQPASLSFESLRTPSENVDLDSSTTVVGSVSLTSASASASTPAFYSSHIGQISEEVTKKAVVDPLYTINETENGVEESKSLPPGGKENQINERKESIPKEKKNKDEKGRDNAENSDISNSGNGQMMDVDFVVTGRDNEVAGVEKRPENNNNKSGTDMDMDLMGSINKEVVDVSPEAEVRVKREGEDEDDEDEDQEKEEDEEDELYDDLTDDEDSKRPVIDCLSNIFFDTEEDERQCLFCNWRAEKYSLPKFDFSDFGLRNLIRHAKTEHPGAWMNQRTGQTDIDLIQ